MAVIDIHITKKYILTLPSGDAGYNIREKCIILHLSRISEFNKIIDSVDNFIIDKNMIGKTFEQQLCYIITHEEIHHWINENEDAETSIEFDNISTRVMEGQ